MTTGEDREGPAGGRPVAGRPAGSIRRTLTVGASIFTAVLALVVGAFTAVNVAMRADLTDATTNLVEEQRIADRLTRAVTRQLVTASHFVTQQDSSLVAAFRSAGQDAYQEIRRYLFRDLTSEQRLTLEAVREEHQRLEVAASQSFHLFRNGRAEEGRASAEAMVDHAMSLQEAVDEFVSLREADLGRLSAQQDRMFRYLTIGFALVGLLLLVGILFLGRFLHRRLGQPITELTDSATAIEQGRLDVYVRVPYDDEFAEVGAAFNRMAESLTAARADVENRNRQLKEALDELKTTQRELIQSEKMSATGRMMAGLAHELNNPLASVLGYGELLQTRLREDDPPGLDEIEDVLDPIVGEAVRARGLVQNLLRFSRRSESVISTIPLVSSLEVVVGLRAYAFEQAGLELMVGPLPDCHVLAEEQRLQQVLLNVINNAFDAMLPAQDGALRIRATDEGTRVSVSFEDTGPGFSDPDQVFEPFYTTKPVGEGTGLGLSLVHRFMEDFGGQVQAENREEGGARVVLTFLRGDANAEASAPADQQDDVPAATDGGEAKPARVLVVEDEAPLRDLQRRLLSRINVEVLTASTGSEAARLLEDQEVDLVVSDIKMPGGSGLELFRWVEENRPALVDRFLFVTGDAEEPEVAALAEAEPHRFVHKPFQMDDYLGRIIAALP